MKIRTLLEAVAGICFSVAVPATLFADCRMAVSNNGVAVDSRLLITSTAGRLTQNVTVPDTVDSLAVSSGSNAKLYIAEHNARTIVSANLDGSAQQTVLQLSEIPLSMAVSGNNIYWSSSLEPRGSTDGGIFRAPRNGGAIEQIVFNIAPPYGLSFGPDGRMYWVSTVLDQPASLFRGSIWSARSDGTDIRQVADLTVLAQQIGRDGNSLPYGLAIDPEDGTIYVAENFTGVSLLERVIWRLDSDGKNAVIFARFPGALTVPGPSLFNDIRLDSESHALFVAYTTLFSPEGSGIFRLPTEDAALPYNYDAASNDPRDLHRYRLGIAGEHLTLIGEEQEMCETTKTLSGASESDYIVWRPKLGQWFVLASNTANNSSFYTRQWGLPGDVPLMANFNGDSTLDMTVWRRSEGMWYVCDWNLQGQCANTYVSQWGLPGDYPIIADFNGDGLSDLTVWRPANGTWYYRAVDGGEARVRQWGLPGDIPLTGDFNADGRDDFVVFRPQFGLWFILYSSFDGGEPPAEATIVRQWGLPGDVPLTEDFDGDRRPDLAVWRPASGMWYICLSTTQYQCQTKGVAKQFGLFGDVPIRGDFDGDGLADVAVWRPSFGNWYYRSSLTGELVVRQWGLPADFPLDAGTALNGPQS